MEAGRNSAAALRRLRFRDYRLAASTASLGEWFVMRLAHLKEMESPLETTALVNAHAIHAIDCIAKVYYEDFPKYRPLLEMVNNLAKSCCPGVAQTIGPNLPPEVTDTWPHFSRIFEDARGSHLLTWPDVCTSSVYPVLIPV